MARVCVLSTDRSRADALCEALAAHGHQAVASSRPHPADCLVTTGTGPRDHSSQLLRRRGAVPWLLDVGDGWADPPPGAAGFLDRRLELRLLRAADAVLCASQAAKDRVHERVGASTLVARADAGEALAAQVDALLRLRESPADLRVLMLGPVNSPHVEHMTLALRTQGVDVCVAGDVWPGLPPSVLPSAGVAVDCVAPPFVPWLRRVVRRARPHVVHAHWTPFAFKALVARARPLVVTPWGSDIYLARGRFARANRPVARRADRIVTDSRDLLERLADLGAPRERLVLLNWGVDLDLFTPPSEDERRALRARLGLEAGPVVLSPRTLREVYNPGVILDAFRRVAEAIPDAQLVLKHMGNDEPELGELPPRVRVIGHVPYEEMADWYRAADACVSIASSDSSPRSVWEAMACGCPCVVSDLPWVHETITPGEQALVCEIAPEPVAAALESLLTDGALADRIGQAGRALVEAERDQAAEMRRLAETYRELAGLRPPGG